MKTQIRILLIEDSHDDVALIKKTLEEGEIFFLWKVVETIKEYQQQLLGFKPDLVISDHSLPEFSFSEALEIFLHYKHQEQRSAAFVLLARTVFEEYALEALKNGADDYVLKNHLRRLPSAVMNALERNKMKEEKRKEEEKRLHLLGILQKSLHEIYVMDPQTLVYEYVNDEGLRNLGYTSEEILKLTPADTIYDFNEDRFRTILKSVEQSSKGRIYERYAVRKDGSKYPLQIHLEVIKQGQKKLFLANCLDITENKEHEQQKEIALFIQNSFNEERPLEISLQIVMEELCRRSTVPAAEIWAREFGEGVRRYAQWKEAGQKEPVAGKFFTEKVFSTGESYEFEKPHQFLEYDLQYKGDYYQGVAAYPIKSGNEITAVILFYTKQIIRERDPFVNLREGVQDKLASNIKRKKTEEELQKIFELSPDILTILGKDGYVRKINPALHKMLGYTPEELLQRTFDDLIHPDDKHLLTNWRNTILEKDEVAHYESRWLTASGSYRHIAWSLTPFLEGDLNFAVGKDMTEHKRQMESIRKQNERLAEIAWEQSHTVRAPLVRLLACVAYLEEYGENHEKLLASIKASAHELDEIVKEIVGKTKEIV